MRRASPGVFVSARCGYWAGNFLESSETVGNTTRDYRVAPVYCLCQNDNRCAVCAHPLNRTRLGARFFDPTNRKVTYVSGFHITHKC